jgi:hypothetical protein
MLWFREFARLGAREDQSRQASLIAKLQQELDDDDAVTVAEGPNLADAAESLPK